jgi:hypothetical protein
VSLQRGNACFASFFFLLYSVCDALKSGSSVLGIGLDERQPLLTRPLGHSTIDSRHGEIAAGDQKDTPCDMTRLHSGSLYFNYVVINRNTPGHTLVSLLLCSCFGSRHFFKFFFGSACLPSPFQRMACSSDVECSAFPGEGVTVSVCCQPLTLGSGTRHLPGGESNNCKVQRVFCYMYILYRSGSSSELCVWDFRDSFTPLTTNMTVTTKRKDCRAELSGGG